jgi:hypothetical protein
LTPEQPRHRDRQKRAARDKHEDIRTELRFFALKRLENVATRGILGTRFILRGMNNDFIGFVRDLNRALALGARTALTGMLVANIELCETTGTRHLDGHRKTVPEKYLYLFS